MQQKENRMGRWMEIILIGIFILVWFMAVSYTHLTLPTT